LSNSFLAVAGEDRMARKLSFVVIIGFLVIYILPLGVRPIAIPDESRYGEIPREMLVSGDWIVPHLNGLRYFEKPVLGYWLNAISIKLFGENAFAIRFPSALAAGISALLLFILILKFTGSYLAAVVAPVVLLTCLQFFLVGTLGILDSMFSLFVTGTMIMAFWAYSEQHLLKKLLLLAAAGIFCGMAFLTKGFLVFALLTGVIVPFVIWERRPKEILPIVLVPVLVAALVALPWCISIHRREPDFWNYFFWNEHIRRFMSGSAQHSQPFWYFIPILIGGAMPWTVFLVVIIQGLKKIGLKNPLARFGICWFGFCFIFFSASNGKIATYIMPCFPPLALLITLGFLQFFETDRMKHFENAANLSAVIAAIFGVVVIVNQMMGLPSTAYGPQEIPQFCLAIAAAITWGVFSLLAAKASNFRRKLLFYCFAPLLFLLCMPVLLPDALEGKMAADKVLIKYAATVKPDTILVADSRVINAVCWVYKRTDVYCLGGGELEYGLSYNDANHRLLDLETFRDMLANSKNIQIMLVARDRKYAKWENQLPQPTFVEVDKVAAIAIAEFKAATANKSQSSALATVADFGKPAVDGNR
jgi:4-amino-4-deoxy-L-arabinose transferase